MSPPRYRNENCRVVTPVTPKATCALAGGSFTLSSDDPRSANDYSDYPPGNQAAWTRSTLFVRLKHRWNVGHNYLAGITASDWIRLLRANRFAVDPVYWHRAAFITLSSLMNSISRRKEERRFNAAV